MRINIKIKVYIDDFYIDVKDIQICAYLIKREKEKKEKIHEPALPFICMNTL